MTDYGLDVFLDSHDSYVMKPESVSVSRGDHGYDMMNHGQQQQLSPAVVVWGILSGSAKGRAMNVVSGKFLPGREIEGFDGSQDLLALVRGAAS